MHITEDSLAIPASEAVDILLKGLPHEGGPTLPEESIRQWEREERRLLAAQRLFSAEIARRTRALRTERNAAVSIFSNLPVELQVPILMEALEGSTIGVLSTVSTRWNSIIEGTPQFWSSINLDKGGSIVERSLQLASGALLTITGGDGDRILEHHELQRHVLLLLQHTDRIRSLTIKTLYLKELRPLLQSPFPQLEYLRIGKNAGRTVHIVFGDMPKLRNLIARAISLSSFFGIVETLRVVDLGIMTVSAQDILDFVQRHPGLEEITLDRVASSDPTDQPQVLSNTDLLEVLLISDPSPLPTQLFSVLENQGSRSSLLAGFTRNSKWERLHLHLGAGGNIIDTWAKVTFSYTSQVTPKEAKLFLGRVASPDELLLVVRAIRALIGVPCPVSMTVQWIWPRWTTDQLRELSNLLDVRSFTFTAANTWNQLLKSGLWPPRWPNLESVFFPRETLNGRTPHQARMAAETLTNSRGGEVRLALYGKTVECYWKKEVKAK